MLDLSYSVRRLTQGRGAAEMTLARLAEEAPSSPAEASAPPESGAESRAAEVDPYPVAERVYQFMRRDLRVHLERRA
jgi:hypothetical protein